MNARNGRVVVLICALTPLDPSRVHVGMATHCRMIREHVKVFSNIWVSIYPGNVVNYILTFFWKVVPCCVKNIFKDMPLCTLKEHQMVRTFAIF